MYWWGDSAKWWRKCPHLFMCKKYSLLFYLSLLWIQVGACSEKLGILTLAFLSLEVCYATKKNEGDSRSAEFEFPSLNFVKTMTQRIHYLLMKLCSAVVLIWWNLCAVLWCCSSRVSSAHLLSLVDLTYLLFEDFHAVTAYSTYAAFAPIVTLDFPHWTASRSGSRNFLKGAVPLVPFLSPSLPFHSPSPFPPLGIRAP